MGTETGNWLTVEEAAERLRVKPRTMRKWAQTGEISAWKAGRDWRIDPADVQRYIDAHRNT
jgi:excisionase family DNA binding protein